jgi:hypothetical protein
MENWLLTSLVRRLSAHRGLEDPVSPDGMAITHRQPRRPVLLLALTVVGCAVVWMGFIENFIGIDEIGLFNPVYMYATSGHMAYPAYGFFDGMFVHPPTHYLVVALAMKAGLPLACALALPPFLLVLVTIRFIVWSRLSTLTQVALLFGFFAGVFLPWHALHTPFGLSLRPDVHLALAWFAGLIALETGRLASWNPFRLFVGSFLLTYASGLHYPAIIAWTGVMVYLAWVLKDRGWAAGRGSALALLGGGAAFGVPFLVLFWIPHWPAILDNVRTTDPFGGVRESLAAHVAIYQRIWQAKQGPLLTDLLFWPLRFGIPTLLLSTGVLVVKRETRGIALASLPCLLFVLLVVQRKVTNVPYLLPEFTLYLSALALAPLVALRWLTRQTVRLPVFRRDSPLVTGDTEEGVTAAGASALAALLVFGTPWWAEAMYASLPRVDEMKVARAAGRLILGPNALVGHRLTRFYTSGAAHSYLIQTDLLWDKHPPFELGQYFSMFDAFAEDPHLSDRTANAPGKSLASWYAGGELHLRGFYFSARHPDLTYLLLASARPQALRGYAMLEAGEVVRFRESSDGNHLFLAVVCDQGLTPEISRTTELSSSYLLPARTDADRRQVLHTLVVGPEDSAAAEFRSKPGCIVRDRVSLQRDEIDARALVAALDGDQPIRFYRTLEGSAGAWTARHGPPAKLEVREDGWPVRITFLRGPGAGTEVSLSGPEVCEALRTDMERPEDWELTKPRKRGRLAGAPDGLAAGDRGLRFLSGGSRDQIASPAPQSCSQPDFLFFSMWVKDVDSKTVPEVTLRSRAGILGRGSPVCRRHDGWVLVAGWSSPMSAEGARLVVTDLGRHTVMLLDKGLIVGVRARWVMNSENPRSAGALQEMEMRCGDGASTS